MKFKLSATQALGLYMLLSCSQISLALAHGDDAGEHNRTANAKMEDIVEQGLSSYFSLSEDFGLICTHIALMTVAWVVVLPVAVMLSIATSRYTLLAQALFTAINTLGVLAGLVYNARTPDMYPNNAHHKIGWIITAVISVHIILGVISRRISAQSVFGSQNRASEQSFVLLSETTGNQGHSYGSRESRFSRYSNYDAQDDYPSSMGSSSDVNRTEVGDDESPLPTYRQFYGKRHARRDGRLSIVTDFLENLNSIITLRSPKAFLSYVYKTTDRIILPFGFIAFTTGIATFGRFFEGRAIYSGLAHWAKGGIFFWLGLFNLGRWAGSFADLGWAWNIRPRRLNSKNPPSAEFVESSLIFFYGATNIFLEHLGNTDGVWRANDLEHLAITILFIGGGLCGMLIESTRVRDLLSAAVPAVSAANHDITPISTPPSYGLSLNPIPALVIALLGIMMGSHHQASMTSTMVHKQWGDLLLGASFSRCLTYILMYIRPPTSALPSRPPTELLASFGLIAGGVIFMASSKDTVKGMVKNDLGAMFLYTVTMGLVAILMAWELVVLALKGLAVRKENSYLFKS